MPYETDKEKEEKAIAARKARVHERAVHYVSLGLTLSNAEDISIEADAMLRAGRSLQRLRGGSDREDD